MQGLDKFKLLIAILLIVAGIYGFYHFAEQKVALLYRVFGLLGMISVALGLAATTQVGAETLSFGRESVREVRKSVWPSRKDTGWTTLIVLAMVLLVGVMLWLFDTMLLWAVRQLTGQGG
ncbi:MAG: preprotein translocase subunit SecE [Gammaproteobacteria bacterium]|nr:preprotein translocase subunit SecE [Gammaproteobacteria bacterium]MDH5651230.1 preprotein translocase subunit SecE [Gammaproteobacteria bacterium]